MIWLEQLSAHRTLTSAWWLGMAIVAQSWRLPLAAITTTVYRRRARGGRVRMAAVSRAWLREYEAACVKHEDAR